MKATKARNCVWLSLGTAILAVALVPVTARATAYTWTGTTSNVWALSTNWSGGTYPNSASDQATINDPTHGPAQITGSITLGTTSPALTIGDSAGATALDIASGGTLAMNGTAAGISNNKIITIEGTLNANYSTGTTTRHYSISGTGSLSLVGGTINGSGTRSYWDINQPLSGYGALANRIFSYSTITANNATPITITGSTFTLQGGTLAASGSGSFTNSGTIGGFGLISAPVTNTGSISSSGGTLTITSTIKGGTLAHTTEVDLNGATLTGGVSINNATGPVNLTGDCTFAGAVSIGSNGAFNLNGHTISLTNDSLATPPTLSIISAVTVGTGTIDNATASNVDMSQGPYNLAGGSLTSSGGGALIRGGIYGWGTISAPLIPIGSAAIVSANSSGHTLYITGAVTMTNASSNGNLVASSGGILDLAAGAVLTTTGPSNFTGYVSPGAGTVNLDGVNIVGGTSPIKLNTGTTNVVSDSTLGGSIDCASTLTINSGKKLSISGSSASVSLSAGSLTNDGTLAVGAGTLTNATAGAYTLGGGGSVTLAGGSIAGANGFVSTNTLSGHGTVSAPYTNNGKVVADGGGTEQTLALTGSPTGSSVANAGGQGWFAQNHGKLTLPAVSVNSAGGYTWGGNPATLEMVNSVGVTFSGVSTAGTVSVALLSPDRADVPAGLTGAVGVWQFTRSGLVFGTVDVTFRYDAAAAVSLGLDPSQLRLYRYDGASWTLVSGTTNDTANDLLTATGLTEFSVYAIAGVAGPATPSAPQLGLVTGTTVQLVSPGSENDATTDYLVQEVTTGQYVGPTGLLQAVPVWQARQAWAGTVVWNLSGSTAYQFRSKARNGAAVESGFGPAANTTTTLVGDINGDGHIDVVDLLTLADAFGSVTGGPNYNVVCDLNGDGSVDVIDLLILADNWGA